MWQLNSICSIAIPNLSGVLYAVFSQAVEYSLRAMVMLTASESEPLTVQTMAERGQIPAPYLSKLLQGLARAGLIVSQRGIGGGYKLSRNPAEISLADVVKVIEPMKRLAQNTSGTPVSKTIGPLDQKLDQTIALVESVFEKTSLEDLRKDNLDSFPLCSPPSLVNLEFNFPKPRQSS
jgi:Rrf2 family nitric oxide-sensitive transcriptional repressor